MKFRTVVLALTLCLISAAVVAGRQSSNELSADEVIRRFAAAESENKIARNNYTFTQDIEILTLGEGGSITGRFKRISDIVYDNLGNRVEKITHFPVSTATITFTQEDMKDLGGVQPFALTIEDLPKYNVVQVGKERLDELSTYVFDVKPKKLVKGERYLEGRIWVDDRDYQIVKVAGRGVPEDEKNQYPSFETYRENIDGRYWFPTYAYADDVLEFKNGDIRMRMTIRYTNYKKFTTGIRVEDGGEEATPEESKEPQINKTTKPPAPELRKEEKPEAQKPELKKRGQKRP
ncbi:MAG TPA: hypothetical protein VF131_15520 [Blastocatellia bacterium]|nr:hypothetical protein [Blastocatellia bacterium]